MATYFHGNSEIQASAEGLQTLVLMNPTYVQFSDTPQPQNNLVFLNSAVGASHLSHPHPTNGTQQFVGIPLDPNSHDVSTLHGLIPRVHYNFYNQFEHASAARELPRAQQGLSLSLSPQQPPPPRYGHEDLKMSVSSGSGVSNVVLGMQGGLLSSKYFKAAQELLDEVVSVNSDGIKSELSKKDNGVGGLGGDNVAGESSGGDGTSGGGGEASRKGVQEELTTSERQEIQMKKAKLISMLEEVEQRYRQYHHQMQIVISSFEQAASIGAAKTYTALALQTISKQFRCLKDAIIGQLKAANKSLGEEDSLSGKPEGSRLKYVDHHYRQQRALQQLGMIQHNAWRPQKGLPERSVSVLRAWLFEHFLHPYPKDSDKLMLAKQTGLTRSQVSNWFINARVRLWKPMVEEMYLEEIKEQEKNGLEDKTNKNELNEGLPPKSLPDDKNLVIERSFKTLENSPNQHPTSKISMSTSSTSPVGGNLRNQPGFSLIGSSEFEGIVQGSPKKHRSTDLMQPPAGVTSINMDLKPNNEQMSIKFGDERQSRDGYSFFGGQTNFIGGFGQYPIGELGRFEAEQFAPRFSGNSVSLSLGLPNQDLVSLSAPHQNFVPNQNIQLGRRVEIGEPNEFGSINSSVPHSSTAFDAINIQNRKRFAAQLLPADFVA